MFEVIFDGEILPWQKRNQKQKVAVFDGESNDVLKNSLMFQKLPQNAEKPQISLKIRVRVQTRRSAIVFIASTPKSTLRMAPLEIS
jgi:hypothetical protein